MCDVDCVVCILEVFDVVVVVEVGIDVDVIDVDVWDDVVDVIDYVLDVVWVEDFGDFGDEWIGFFVGEFLVEFEGVVVVFVDVGFDVGCVDVGVEFFVSGVEEVVFEGGDVYDVVVGIDGVDFFVGYVVIYVV